MSLTLDIEGPAAPPRLNGELVFDEPWEGRSFAMVAALAEGGHFSWDEFRDHLIAAIARWEADPSGEYRYYERWQEALESIVAEREIVAGPEMDELAAAYAARPPGHDHGENDHHHHDHDHS
ncbi:MAG: nitrile hydratase accessory protein [Acidimicrobiaceae bacterium]|nr:nitrile hydratase accessory protein [Acidimicrobiaceae bacterium]MXW98086.1 nitrile hydratase accessory protein [Acidimicrobiaceae bacterium]MYH92116.1 nitrile hydratase accessory protein [Acidimicrobiaceae bacterium]